MMTTMVMAMAMVAAWMQIDVKQLRTYVVATGTRGGTTSTRQSLFVCRERLWRKHRPSPKATLAFVGAYTPTLLRTHVTPNDGIALNYTTKGVALAPTLAGSLTFCLEAFNPPGSRQLLELWAAGARASGAASTRKGLLGSDLSTAIWTSR